MLEYLSPTPRIDLLVQCLGFFSGDDKSLVSLLSWTKLHHATDSKIKCHEAQEIMGFVKKE